LSSQQYFRHINGVLHCEEVTAEQIAEAYGTPCYVYSASSLRARFQRMRDAFARWKPLVCFSVKSCGNLSVLNILRECGSGFDVVSGGEIYRALLAGAEPSKIVYAGVGKTEAEIRYALEVGVKMFNVESPAELRAIGQIAGERGCTAPVLLRVNPDVDAGTHEKITTGKEENKFGVALEVAQELLEDAKNSPSVRIRGVHMHLGSSIYSTRPYEQALDKVVGFVQAMRARGHRLDTVNIGGGYCISYTGEEVIGPERYADALECFLEKLDCEVIIEPGRYISGNSGVLLTRVIYRKESQAGKVFLICDASMTELVRPTLYEAFHRIWPVECRGGMPEVIRPGDKEFEGFATEVVDVVGPVCESGDFLAQHRALPVLEEGSLLAVFGAGAYGFTMSSNYNARPRPPEVMVDGRQVKLIRRRETYGDLVALETDLV